MQARVHAAMGNLDLALPILTGLRNLSKDDATKREALRLSGDFYAQKKDTTRAIQAWLDEVALGTEDQAEDVRARIRELASGTSDKKSLEQIRSTFPRNFPGDLASLRLIDLYISRGEEHQAIRQIQQFLVKFPDPSAGSKNIGLTRHTPSQTKIQPVFYRRRPAALRKTRSLRR